MAKKKYAEIVFNSPVNQSFTYEIPSELVDICIVGKRVGVKLRNSNKTGFIISISENTPPYKTKEIDSVIDKDILFTKTQMELAKWMSSYYLCSFGEALSTILPSALESGNIYNEEIDNIEELSTLNDEQKLVADEIGEHINTSKSITSCIFGITGSGKTEVYKHLCKKALDIGKMSLILVPEISLTPQTIGHFKRNFGSNLAIMHSHLNPKERFAYYKKIQNNETNIILGARSAIFCPPEKLGIIIIDEEHENTYKSDDTPRYHARQVALKISKMQSIPVVLGSATPSIETMYYAKKGIFKLYYLKKRHGKHQKPDIRIIDMKKDINKKKLISPPLFEALKDRLDKEQQSLIFLNKRGYASFILCPECGYVKYCPNCNVTLTYHHGEKFLLCHYCNHQEEVPDICPECGYDKIKYSGIGTEKVLEVFKKHFDTANIDRMDADTTKRKGAHEKIIKAMEKGNIDILIGTQMITKGLHIPNISLVGVLLADISLNIPDFRSAERTFNLLAQVAGRAGRGQHKGEIIVQTHNPNHSAIKYLKEVDYESFYNHEIEIRSMYSYPPFARFVRLVFRSISEEGVAKDCHSSYRIIKKISSTITEEKIEIFGPSPCPLEKIKKNFRWHIILRANKANLLKYIVNKLREEQKISNKTYMEIDVDPISML